jgi:phage baseplate assembly protein W
MYKRPQHKINPIDLDTDIATGIGLPMSGVKYGTFNSLYTSKEQIIANLRNLILTMKGERVMEPEFGTDVYRIIFENVGPGQTIKVLTASIKAAVKRWMPLLNIVDVTADMDEHLLTIGISFTVPGYAINEEIKLNIQR